MLKFVGWLRRSKFFGHELGASLIEVVIAIVVLGLVVASVPTAIIAVHNFQSRQRELRYAENLARSEFEYIKSQPYKSGNGTEPVHYYDYDQTVMPDEGPILGGTYYVTHEVRFVDPATHESVGNETGIQEILIRVWGVRGTGYERIYEFSNYKTNRY